MTTKYHKVTWKEFGTRRSKYASWTSVWPGRGEGRWWKRALSKARRRHIKAELRGIRGKEPTGYETTVNWKTW